MGGSEKVGLASSPPPRYNQSAVFDINGKAGRRGKPPAQEVRRTVGPTVRGTPGAQAGNGNCLRSGGRQARVKLVGESPREPHRREVRVGAWNVRSLRQDDQLPLLPRDLGKLRVEVAALSEVRRPGSGITSLGGYNYYWSGRSDGHHLQGLSFGFMSLIAVFAPTDVCKLNMKEMSYAKLASMADRCNQRNIHIVLGDFNAVSGCD
ncbi:uncharacterized protein [Penaeus vannamei]|uniref:uncharacterized protein n=1 Tax=Penaeus vannamei TaxID=6689 RepID=UPI00387F84C7